MIDFKKLITQQEKFLSLLNSRGEDFTTEIKTIITLHGQHHTLLAKTEKLAHELNVKNKLIPANVSNWNQHLQILKTQKNELQKLLQSTKSLQQQVKERLSKIPNIPHPSVPVGNDEQANKVVFTSKNSTRKSNVLHHREIAEKLHWVNWEIPAQNVQARFVIYQGNGAHLLRLLQNFCLDFHNHNNYWEVSAPNLIKGDALWGTGQFPKMQSDCYQIAEEDLYLLPTAETSLINYYQNKLFTVEQLPQKTVGYSLCFRREAGAAGKETRGLMRLHQFHKVEMVKLTTPETSYTELGKMVKEVEQILILLNLPYRIIELCTGDLGFASSKTYDIEVWMPSQQKYIEISSLSNTEDFQARKLNIKFQNSLTDSKKLVHTLNGSGLALDRLFACLLETYYDETSQNWIIPPALKKYQERPQQFFIKLN